MSCTCKLGLLTSNWIGTKVKKKTRALQTVSKAAAAAPKTTKIAAPRSVQKRSAKSRTTQLGNTTGSRNPFQDDEFLTAAKRALGQEIEVVDEYRLRKVLQKEKHVTLSGSSPPACAATMFLDGIIRHVDIKRLKKNKLPTGPVMHDSLVKSTIGTARHELMQLFLGKNASVIADWKCARCETKETASFYKPCKEHGKACSKVPEELGFAIFHKGKKRLGGKIDVLWMDSNKDLWIVDLKFVNRYKLEYIRKHVDMGYERQQGRYLAALKRRFKRLIGYKLFYQNSIEEQISPQNTFVRSVKLDENDWNKLTKKFNAELDKVAVGADTAVKVVADKKLTSKDIALIKEHKACKDRDWYETHVQTTFYQCPLAEQCLAGRLGKGLKEAYSELKKEL